MKLPRARSLIAVAVLLILALIGVTFGKAKNYVTDRLLPQLAQGPARVKFSQVAAEPLPVAPVPAESEAPLFVNHQMSEECESQRFELAKLGFDDFARQLREGFVGLSPHCGSFDAQVPFAASVYENCKLVEPGQFANDGLCQGFLRLYRAYVVDQLSWNETNYANLPLPVLINKFLGRQMSQGGAAAAELRKMALEIQRLEPENPSTYKMLSSLSMMEGGADFAQGRAWVDEGLRRNPNDSQLQDAYFYLRANDAGFDYNSVASASAHPSARYYQASRALKNGDRALAESLLGSLMAQDPQNRKYQETRDRLMSGDPGAFRIEFTFDGDW